MIIVNIKGHSGTSIGLAKENNNLKNLDRINGSLTDFLTNVPQSSGSPLAAESLLWTYCFLISSLPTVAELLFKMWRIQENWSLEFHKQTPDILSPHSNFCPNSLPSKWEHSECSRKLHSPNTLPYCFRTYVFHALGIVSITCGATDFYLSDMEIQWRFFWCTLC